MISINDESVKAVENKIIASLKEIYDPEIPVDIFELGLIYEVKIKEDGFVEIDMTLTSPNCPVAESLPVDVKNKVESVDEVEECKVNIVFDPPWDKDMMSEEAQLELGFL
ncbi:MAG: SUF system Fe-S cluster assembly protein [Crocinitomicaceae bacterium]